MVDTLPLEITEAGDAASEQHPQLLLVEGQLFLLLFDALVLDGPIRELVEGPAA